MQLKALKLDGELEREYRFHKTRKWRFDFAWPLIKVACEVEGGHWVGGRHQRGAGFDADAEKYNEAMLDGWRVIRVTSTHIKSGQAAHWINQALMANPTRAERLHWSRLVSVVGCVACRVEHGIYNPECSIHHIDGRTKPGAHMNVLPLCGLHHQTGGEGVAIHPFKRQWEAKYGTQEELRNMCKVLIKKESQNGEKDYPDWV